MNGTPVAPQGRVEDKTGYKGQLTSIQWPRPAKYGWLGVKGSSKEQTIPDSFFMFSRSVGVNMSSGSTYLVGVIGVNMSGANKWTRVS